MPQRQPRDMEVMSQVSCSASHKLLSTQMLRGRGPPVSSHPQNAFLKTEQPQLSP